MPTSETNFDNQHDAAANGGQNPEAGASSGSTGGVTTIDANKVLVETMKVLQQQVDASSNSLKTAGNLLDEDKLPLQKGLQRGTIKLYSCISEENHPDFKTVKATVKMVKERSLYQLANHIGAKNKLSEALKVLSVLAIPSLKEDDSVETKALMSAENLLKVITRVSGFRTELSEAQLIDGIASTLKQSAGAIHADDSTYYRALEDDLESYALRLNAVLQGKAELVKTIKELQRSSGSNGPGSPYKKLTAAGNQNKWCFRYQLKLLSFSGVLNKFLTCSCTYKGQSCAFGKHPSGSGATQIGKEEYEQLQKKFSFLVKPYLAWEQEEQKSTKGKGKGKGGK